MIVGVTGTRRWLPGHDYLLGVLSMRNSWNRLEELCPAKLRSYQADAGTFGYLHVY